jgi:hypothetical protein
MARRPRHKQEYDLLLSPIGLGPESPCGKSRATSGRGQRGAPPSTGWASQFVMVSFCPTDILAGAKTAVSNWVTTYLRLGGRNIVRTLTPLRHWFVEPDTLVLQQATTLSDIGVRSCPENGSCRIIRPMRIQRRARPVLSFHVHHGVLHRRSCSRARQRRALSNIRTPFVGLSCPHR